MKQIKNFDEMKEGEKYSYGNPQNFEDEEERKAQTFVFLNQSYRDCVELQYLDGYVGEPPEENFRRHIDEGKVYKV